MVVSIIIKRIIRHMLEFARRVWQIFIPAFAVLIVGSVSALIWLGNTWYHYLVSMVLAILAVIALIIGVVAFICDFKDTRRKDKEAKEPSVYEKRGPLAF